MTNTETAELDSTLNEEIETELDSTTNEEEVEDETEETEENSESEEEQKSSKKRKSWVSKLLSDKNTLSSSLKNAMDIISEKEKEIEELKANGGEKADIDEALLEKKLAERDLEKELANEYPDVDLSEAKKFAKEEGCKITHAFKLLNIEVADKQRKSSNRTISGSSYDATTPVYSMSDLGRMSQADYNKAVALIEKGKAKLKKS